MKVGDKYKLIKPIYYSKYHIKTLKHVKLINQQTKNKVLRKLLGNNIIDDLLKKDFIVKDGIDIVILDGITVNIYEFYSCTACFKKGNIIFELDILENDDFWHLKKIKEG
jgi:hypothetical protein